MSTTSVSQGCPVSLQAAASGRPLSSSPPFGKRRRPWRETSLMHGLTEIIQYLTVSQSRLHFSHAVTRAVKTCLAFVLITLLHPPQSLPLQSCILIPLAASCLALSSICSRYHAHQDCTLEHFDHRPLIHDFPTRPYFFGLYDDDGHPTTLPTAEQPLLQGSSLPFASFSNPAVELGNAAANGNGHRPRVTQTARKSTAGKAPRKVRHTRSACIMTQRPTNVLHCIFPLNQRQQPTSAQSPPSAAPQDAKKAVATKTLAQSKVLPAANRASKANVSSEKNSHWNTFTTTTTTTTTTMTSMTTMNNDSLSASSVIATAKKRATPATSTEPAKKPRANAKKT